MSTPARQCACLGCRWTPPKTTALAGQPAAVGGEALVDLAREFAGRREDQRRGTPSCGRSLSARAAGGWAARTPPSCRCRSGRCRAGHRAGERAGEWSAPGSASVSGSFQPSAQAAGARSGRGRRKWCWSLRNSPLCAGGRNSRRKTCALRGRDRRLPRPTRYLGTDDERRNCLGMRRRECAAATRDREQSM